MKEYDVRVFYHTYDDVRVFADCEEDAIALAYEMVDRKELMANLQEDADPIVEEV